MDNDNSERCVNTMELLNILIDQKYQGHFNSEKELKNAFKAKIEFIIKDDKSSSKIEDLKKIIDYYVKNRNNLGWVRSGIIENSWMDNKSSIEILNEAMDDLINKYKKHDDSESETDSTISSFSNDSIEKMIEELDIKLSSKETKTPHKIKGKSRRGKKSKRKRKTKRKSNKKKSNKKRKTKRKSNKKKGNLKKKHK